MVASFHPEAQREFYAAIDYYEECRDTLGCDFAGAVDRIAGNPSAWPAVDKDIRRCLTRRFPYGLLYEMSGDRITILAVMHLHRNPDYWKNRRT